MIHLSPGNQRLALSAEADAARAVIRYHDVNGKIVHEVAVEARN